MSLQNTHQNQARCQSPRIMCTAFLLLLLLFSLLTSAWRLQSSPSRRRMSQCLKPVSDGLCAFVTRHLVARSGLSPALRPSVQTTQRHLEGSALSHTAPTPQDMQAGRGAEPGGCKGAAQPLQRPACAGSPTNAHGPSPGPGPGLPMSTLLSRQGHHANLSRLSACMPRLSP